MHDTQLKTVTVKEARSRFSEIVERVAIGGDRYLVTKFGKSKVVIAPASLFVDTECAANAARERVRVLERTFGVWKRRKDIRDGAKWVSKLREQQSSRYGKIFD